MDGWMDGWITGCGHFVGKPSDKMPTSGHFVGSMGILSDFKWAFCRIMGILSDLMGILSERWAFCRKYLENFRDQPMQFSEEDKL